MTILRRIEKLEAIELARLNEVFDGLVGSLTDDDLKAICGDEMCKKFEKMTKEEVDDAHAELQGRATIIGDLRKYIARLSRWIAEHRPEGAGDPRTDNAR